VRILIVGAGASYAEGLRAGLPEKLCPPLIKNFARRLWSDYSPVELLFAYLRKEGYEPTEDPLNVFFHLEETNTTNVNIERFFEFAYRNQSSFPGAYENLLYHGILNPMGFLLLQGLWKGGNITECPMPCAQSVARQLKSGDAVVNLNYDTLFEIGASQAGHQLVFLPNTMDGQKLAICKPHGSLNLVIDEVEKRFCFGNLNWPGNPQPADGSKNYVGFIPPRLNKSYSQHWVSSMILKPTSAFSPHALTFWGVGLTESDTDLLQLYRKWASTAHKVEFINPSKEAASHAQELLDKQIEHFAQIADWEAMVKRNVVPS
jgi:hypothetical protein